MTATRSGWMSADRGRNATGVRAEKLAAFGCRPLKMLRPLPGLRLRGAKDSFLAKDFLRDRRRSPVLGLRATLPVGFDLPRLAISSSLGVGCGKASGHIQQQPLRV